jgi:cell volume regulation protein A
LAAGLVASFVAVRIRVPTLVLFLGVGMLVGSDALGWISFDNYRLARTIGVISLALILFEGGLTTGLLHLRPVLGAATALATVGTAITAVLVGLAAAPLFGFSAISPDSSWGPRRSPAERTVVSFHQGLGWVAQVAMFLTLGLLVSPAHLGSVAVKGAVLAVLLVLVARPAAVAISTLPFAYNWRERTLLGWAGLHGAVPIVLATFPVIEHVPRSLEFFNIVFFAVIVSTVLRGATFETLARRLRLTTSQPALPRQLSESGTIRRLGAEVLEYTIGPRDAIAGAHVRDLGLPRDAVGRRHRP